MIKVVLFDFFGVLYPDTLWGLADVFIPDRTPEQKQALRGIVTRSDMGLIDRHTFWQEVSHVYGADLDKIMKEKEKLGGVDPQLLTLISKLKSNGLKTGIISNVGVGFLEHAFEDSGHIDYFDELILSGALGIVKPDKRIYEIAAEKLAVETQDCLFFDDVVRNVEGARATGMNSEVYEGLESCKAALKKHGITL